MSYDVYEGGRWTNYVRELEEYSCIKNNVFTRLNGKGSQRASAHHCCSTDAGGATPRTPALLRAYAAAATGPGGYCTCPESVAHERTLATSPSCVEAVMSAT